MIKKVLVTGAAGFIGFHLVNELLKYEYEVFGLDNLNEYYDVTLKTDRLKEAGINCKNIDYNNLIASSKFDNYHFIKLDICDNEKLHSLFEKGEINFVINLAAQAGVRYSLLNPRQYIETNLLGFFNVLENCKNFGIEHFVNASSSSVYGLNKKVPYSVDDNVDHPVSLYAATKKSNELMSHSYSHLYELPITNLRFFTVYGPWGRPDMAYYLFTNAIINGSPINVFNNGDMERDFTYIDDIVDGIIKVMQSPALKNKTWDGSHKDVSSSSAPYKIYNIGNNKPIKLLDFIRSLEKALGKKAIIDFKPMQLGDVHSTWADVRDLENDFNFHPTTNVETGIKKFVDWYKKYYRIVL